MGQITDHKAVYIEINTTSSTHTKSPHWKFNNTILEDNSFKNMIYFMINQKIKETENSKKFLEDWDTFKDEIKEESIKYATIKNTERKKRQNILEDEINTAYKNKKQDDKTILEKRKELETIQQYIYKGAKIRAGMRSDVTDETLSAIYLNIEKTTQTARNINELKNANGEIVTDKAKIKNILFEHYKNLFEYEPENEEAQNEILNYSKKLSDFERDILDEELDFEIFDKALKSLDNDKTPGPDGLTTEFYKTFFVQLKPLFEKLVLSILEENRLATSQTVSIIKLLPKDPKEKTIKNLRPISLLNVDYKIITKALTLKLLRFMPDLIHEDQNSSVPERNSINATNMVRDIITYLNDKNESATLLSLDMAAAFDRVNHSFIHKVLEKANFGPYFRKWIEIIYGNPYSALLVNNQYSKLFPIQRSVKQGDPISSLIYVLTLEPLLEKNKKRQ